MALLASKLGRRRFLAEGAALTGAAVLGARGGRSARAQDGTPMASPAARPTMNTEISGSLRYNVATSSQEEVGAIQGILDTVFKERYPNLELQVEPAPSGASGDPLLTQMVAGEAPDIFDAWTSRATPYIGAGQVLDLAPLMARDYTPEALADYFPWVLDTQSLPDGFQWGMPRYVNINVLAYNKDLVEEAGVPDPSQGEGWDHNAYREAMIALTQKQGDNVRVYGAQVPIYFYGPFAEKVEAWGGTPVDPADPTEFAIESFIPLTAHRLRSRCSGR